MVITVLLPHSRPRPPPVEVGSCRRVLGGETISREACQASTPSKIVVCSSNCLLLRYFGDIQIPLVRAAWTCWHSKRRSPLLLLARIVGTRIRSQVDIATVEDLRECCWCRIVVQ